MKAEKKSRWDESEWQELKADWKVIVAYVISLRYTGKYGIDRGMK